MPQKKNGVTYNLLRMNLLMHGSIPYRSFTTYNDDTLVHDNFKMFLKGSSCRWQILLFSLKYSASKSFESDLDSHHALYRLKSYGFRFIEHMVYHMSNDGRIAVLLPHGVCLGVITKRRFVEYLIEH